MVLLNQLLKLVISIFPYIFQLRVLIQIHNRLSLLTIQQLNKRINLLSLILQQTLKRFPLQLYLRILRQRLLIPKLNLPKHILRILKLDKWNRASWKRLNLQLRVLRLLFFLFNLVYLKEIGRCFLRDGFRAKCALGWARGDAGFGLGLKLAGAGFANFGGGQHDAEVLDRPFGLEGCSV